MKTAFQAMRLGIVIYFIPFFFVFQPALVMRGPPVEIIWYFLTCLLGIALLAGGIEGYLTGVGKVGMAMRFFLAVAGLLIAMPEWRSDIIGGCLAFVLIGFLLLRKRTSTKEQAT